MKYTLSTPVPRSVRKLTVRCTVCQRIRIIQPFHDDPGWSQEQQQEIINNYVCSDCTPKGTQ